MFRVGGGDLGGHESGHEHAVEGAERGRDSSRCLVNEDSSVDVGEGIPEVEAFDRITVGLTDE